MYINKTENSENSCVEWRVRNHRVGGTKKPGRERPSVESKLAAAAPPPPPLSEAAWSGRTDWEQKTSHGMRALSSRGLAKGASSRAHSHNIKHVGTEPNLG